MPRYSSRQELVQEMSKRARLFIGEFEEIAEQDKDTLLADVDRSPAQMIAYQLGWMKLIQQWEWDEQAGLTVVTPHPDYKWNQLGLLYQSFYETYQDWTLLALMAEFEQQVDHMIALTLSFSEEDFQQSGSRKWAGSTPANWPVWKWLHINTVAPFKSFRTKIRKWKKIKNG
ncbi:ClbS/DfsB family four-helix bundle protein [Streptococcus sp. DD12]|uniref:ClbS/DfsB family four-helix bundle protein n=1 Tax=Streptococcus sp. DD12 TaxID=1777880 RepID=UPI00082DB521|nr:ClbS/DfsB family four-helix bundle protein [Streptococcus sp. DD12]